MARALLDDVAEVCAMKEVERFREPVSALPTPDHVERRQKEGFRLVAIKVHWIFVVKIKS